MRRITKGSGALTALTFKKHCATVKNTKGEIQFIAERIGDLFFVKEADPTVCKISNENNTLEQWHYRLGHLNFEEVRRMFRTGVIIGLKIEDPTSR